MSNLQSLSLHFAANRLNTFIDGNNLKKNLINYLTELNQFVFNIRSITNLSEQIHFPSNNDIQRTLTNLTESEIISCVDYFTKENKAQCHIYSYPYTLTYYNDITNNFSGGLFKCVREISLFDERPFEHEFFIRIAHAFPFLKILSLTNREAQKQKLLHNDKYSIIEYPHLTE
ncbi:unnamed protein product, partial [Rotaria sordida]